MKTPPPKRVMIVEDNQSIADMYRLQLELDGYDVVWHADAESGLAAMVSETPDLVLMDIRLPGMDGLEALRRINSRTGEARPPVLILTNFGDPDLQAKALAGGARAFLVKSRTAPTELSQQVKAALKTSARAS